MNHRERTHGLYCLVISYLLFFALSSNAAQQPMNDRMFNAGTKVNTPSLIEGENISLRTGQMTWSTVDVSLPGNSMLPVEVRRTYNPDPVYYGEFSGWSLDLPRIVIKTSPNGLTVSPSNGAGNRTNADLCLRPWSKASSTVYYLGVQLKIPGQGTKELVFNDMTSRAPDILLKSTSDPFTNRVPHSRFSSPKAEEARFVTTDNWTATCISTAERPNNFDGFLVKSPDGTEYRFDKVTRFLSLTKNVGWGMTKILPSVVRSVTGSEVRYVYTRVKDSACNPNASSTIACTENQKIRRITGYNSDGSSDGREIRFNYTGASNDTYIDSIDANGDRWTYKYSPNKTFSEDLSRVITPEGLEWEYAYNGPENNSFYTSQIKYNYLDEVIHPFGSKINYKFGKKIANTFGPLWNWNVDVLESRTVSHAKHDPYQTFYSYEKGVMEIGGHQSSITRIHYGEENSARYSEYEFAGMWSDEYGALIGERQFDADLLNPTNVGSTLIKESTYEHYNRIQGNAWKIGTDYVVANVPGITAKPMLFKVTDSIKGNTQINSYSPYGTPSVSEIETPEGRMFTKKSIFFSNTNYWIIDALASQELYEHVNGSKIGDTYKTSLSRNSLGQVTSETVNGLTNKYTYNSFGRVSSSTSFDPYRSDNPVTNYLDYVAGKPQRIEFPDNTFITQEINNKGLVEMHSNQEGHVINYTYDSLGRQDQVIQNGTVLSDTDWSKSEEGGYVVLTQTKVEGNKRTVTLYDGIGQVIRSDVDSLISSDFDSFYIQNQYDQFGNLSKIEKKSDDSGYSLVENKVYDLLGRIVLDERDDVNGKTEYCYMGSACSFLLPNDMMKYSSLLTQNSVVARDGEGYVSIQKLQAQSDGSLLPEEVVAEVKKNGTNTHYVSTNIEYNAIGLATRISKGGVTRSYNYIYGSDRIDTVFEPEAGPISNRYDRLGNLTSKSFLINNPGHIYMVNNKYDDLARIENTKWSDDREVNFEYYPDGQLWKILTGPLNDPDSIWVYEYDESNNITSETLEYLGLSIKFEYTYDLNGNRTSMIYPSGEVLDLQPDSMGRPTKAGRFIKQIQYRSTDTIESIQYGNDVWKQVSYVGESLSSGVKFRKSTSTGTVFNNRTYLHDKRGLLSKINSLPITHDGIGRLTRSEFNGIYDYVYDDADNLTSIKVNGTESTLNIDPSTNRLTSSVKNSVQTNYSYDEFGNISTFGDKVLSFGTDSRLYSVYEKSDINNAIENYTYDGHGARLLTRNVDSSGRVNLLLQVYGIEGQLLYEVTQVVGESSQKVNEYFYLKDQLVAKKSLITTDKSFDDPFSASAAPKKIKINQITNEWFWLYIKFKIKFLSMYFQDFDPVGIEHLEIQLSADQNFENIVATYIEPFDINLPDFSTGYFRRSLLPSPKLRVRICKIDICSDWTVH